MVDWPMAIWLKEVGFVFIPLQVLIFNGSKYGLLFEISRFSNLRIDRLDAQPQIAPAYIV